jgi:uncharacterized protein YabN with tetrapyrrole methylase and pyrophosphatase domain
VVVDEESLGVALAALAVAGAGEGIDGESALSAWANRFKERFVRMEALAAANDVDLAAADPALVRSLWDRTRQVPGN